MLPRPASILARISGLVIEDAATGHGNVGCTKVWALHYRLLVRVMDEVTAPVTELGLDTKELLLLDRVDECPYPADLARQLRWPKPTVTFTVNRVEKKGFVRRDIDSADLRRHRLSLTPPGRKAMTRGMLVVISVMNRS